MSLRSDRRPGKRCNTNIVVDGVQRLDLNLIEPDDIAAIEVYGGTTGAPIQYESLCGVVVIWTKR